MLSFCEKFKLRESDFDYRDNVRLSTYLDIFQTIAAKHAGMLGMGYEQMMSKGIAWVLTKVKFDVLAPLAPDELVTVETRPHRKGIVDYTRDYYIYNEGGLLAAKGSSQWVHIDFSSRKIVKPTEDFEGEFTEEFAYESRKIERIMPSDEPPVFAHRVTRGNLDHNGHTNNIRYADMIFDACDMPNAPYSQVIINYLNETKLGDLIEFSVKREGGTFVYTGRRGGEPCVTAKIVLGM